jgi:hypothetical protein
MMPSMVRSDACSGDEPAMGERASLEAANLKLRRAPRLLGERRDGRDALPVVAPNERIDPINADARDRELVRGNSVEADMRQYVTDGDDTPATKATRCASTRWGAILRASDGVSITFAFS